MAGETTHVHIGATGCILLRWQGNIYAISDEALKNFQIKIAGDTPTLDKLFTYAPQKCDAVHLDLTYMGDTSFIPYP